MEKFIELTEEEGKIICGGTINAGIEFVGLCIAIFAAGFECGRSLAREVKTWF